MINLPIFPPNWPTAKTTPMLQAALDKLAEPWNPFDRSQHEARMNAWLIDYVRRQNARMLSQYLDAWRDYRLNAQRCDEMGIAIPPFTIPPPKLEDVGPMPDGYWFGEHGAV